MKKLIALASNAYVSLISASAWKKHALLVAAYTIYISSASADGIRAASLYENPHAVVQKPRRFSGLYVGGNVDYGFITSNTNVGCVSPAFNFSASPNCYEAIAGGAFVTHFKSSPKGFMGDVQAGYNFRFTNIVLGFVSDIAAGSISGDSLKTTALPTFVPELAIVEERINWFGTVRGRLGFVMNNLLIYTTGGLAYGRVKTSYDLNLPGVLGASGSSSGWQSGWTAGGGGELSFGEVTFSAEYLYFDLGNRDVSSIPVVYDVLQPTTYFPASFGAKGNLFRIGVHFPIG